MPGADQVAVAREQGAGIAGLRRHVRGLAPGREVMPRFGGSEAPTLARIPGHRRALVLIGGFGAVLQSDLLPVIEERRAREPEQHCGRSPELVRAVAALGGDTSLIMVGE